MVKRLVCSVNGGSIYGLGIRPHIRINYNVYTADIRALDLKEGFPPVKGGRGGRAGDRIHQPDSFLCIQCSVKHVNALLTQLINGTNYMKKCIFVLGAMYVHWGSGVTFEYKRDV